MRPLSCAYPILRQVSRQIQLEVSPFLFKDKTLILACDANDAYRYLIQMPSELLKHIKKIRLAEPILRGHDEEDRKNWPRLAAFLGRQMALQEVILHVPDDPSFQEIMENGEDDEDEDDEDDEETKRLMRFKNTVKAWIGYWWPGAKLVMQLLLQKRIAKCVKLRHYARNYLDLCDLMSPAKLYEMHAVAELRHSYDSLLDECWLQKAFNIFRDRQMHQGNWCTDLKLTDDFEKDMLEFDVAAGEDDGFEVVIITRKKEEKDSVPA